MYKERIRQPKIVRPVSESFHALEPPTVKITKNEVIKGGSMHEDSLSTSFYFSFIRLARLAKNKRTKNPGVLPIL